ncbi:type 2 lanthipeptide synthetase LanM [Priestia megaterium]|uniref:type 2 lanthipeptide synthetase LanM n=1 Tax=Priestia megaterium TaxID=1404 RepID=UPI0011AAC400|nr:type 2 lanthipeptide synthetase LanM [Priestia megaterium]
MVTYKKQFYPELEQSDFEDHIAPLLPFLNTLSVRSSGYIKRVDTSKDQEQYPYHNPCRMIARNIWMKVWDPKLDEYLFNSDLFEKAICEQLSQMAFSYLIRCFAEQIKTLPPNNMDSKRIYNYYNQKLMSTEFKEFSEIYSVAWGRCNVLLENKANAIKKAIQLTQKHRIKIQEVFNIANTSRIVSVESGGDTHNNGSSVAIITFEKGEKLVYKPRSVSGEFGYMNFIREINKFISSQMPSLTAVDFGNYGFTSYEETNDETKDMFQAGRLACLMYLLNASDMHYSNILWTNAGPMPIDLETLFHPSRNRIGTLESKKSAYHALEKSVYGTGVLPISLGTKANKGSVDVGFTGIRDENSVSPFKVFNIKDGFSSDIKVVWQRQNIDNALSTDPNLEKLINKRCNELIDGFSNFFRDILQHKNNFINAVIKTFSNSKFRYIHNMTYRYEQILRILTDAEPSKNIDMAHTLLSRTGILSLTSDTNLTLSECKQLWNGDVPYFHIDFKGKEIIHEDEVVAYISESPESGFISKMENLTETELTRQTKLIRLAFVAKLADPHADGKLKIEETESTKIDKLESKTSYDAENNDSLGKEEIISWFSNSLTDTILDDRYAHLPKTWIGPVARFGGQGWTPGVLGYDLYSGRIGPALALAVAGKLSRDERAVAASYDVFEKSAKILGDRSFELRNVLLSGTGAFSGVSGLLWALFAAGNIFGKERWKEIAIDSWPILHRSLEAEDAHFFDMISGKSGSIVMRYQTDKDFKLSDDFINKIISLAYSIINNNDLKTTTGFAHGYGQLIWFLARVNQKQKNNEINRLVKKIDGIIRDKHTNNDGIIEVYKDEDGMHVSSSWCNGLAGLLIAYYEAYKSNILPRESVLNLIKQLKQIPISRVPILCHGSLGILEALQHVSGLFPKETEDILMQINTTFCSPEYIFNYYKNGQGRYPLSPGLMSGKSGALLHLCKSLDSEIKVSPLTFEI